jgi:hypothetical protein
MTSLWQDLRYGLRMLGKNPGFAVIAILTLALGVRATTAIWSAVDSVLLEPLPYSGANRLATPSVSFPDEASITRFPVPIFLDFKEQNHTFEDIIGLAYIGVHYKRSAGTEQLLGAWVTPNTFTFLGVKPLLGREITQEDGKPASPAVFVMSYTLWTRLCNRDPNLLGATLNLNGTQRTLVATMPPRFRFGDGEIWMPLELNRSTFITGFGVQPNEVWTIGRLKRGVSLKAASADLEFIATHFEKTYPAWFRVHYKLVVTLCASKPGSTERSIPKVRIIKPAPTSKTTARLISEITRRERALLWRNPDPERSPLSFSVARSVREAFKAGMSPNKIPVRKEITSVKT